MDNGTLYSVRSLAKQMQVTKAMVHTYIKHNQIKPDYMLDNRQPVFKQETVERIALLHQQQRQLPRTAKRKFEDAKATT